MVLSTTNNNLYMSKADIQRNQVHDAHMKLVIIRLDYSGVIDSSELIKIFDKRFPRAFQNRNYVVRNHSRGGQLGNLGYSPTLSVFQEGVGALCRRWTEHRRAHCQDAPDNVSA